MIKRAVLILTMIIAIVLLFGTVCFADSVNLTAQSLEIPSIGLMTVPDSTVIKEAVPLNDSNHIISQWDMTANELDNWHYARLIFYREENERSSLEMMEYIELKEPFLSMISDLAKGAIEKYADSNGVKLLKWYPAQKSPLFKRNTIMFTAQVILTEKLPLPMYGNIHVFVQDKRLNVLVFLCPDSDRKYWQPIFAKMVGSFK